MYKSLNGIDNLNIILQDLFNPKTDSKREIKVGDIIFREYDKVLQLVNDPDNNVYNGDIGYIEEIIISKDFVVFMLVTSVRGRMKKRYEPTNQITQLLEHYGVKMP